MGILLQDIAARDFDKRPGYGCVEAGIDRAIENGDNLCEDVLKMLSFFDKNDIPAELLSSLVEELQTDNVSVIPRKGNTASQDYE